MFLLYGRGQGTKRLLIIKNAQASDAGIYYCIAVNQAGHANYTVEVEIDCKMSIGITFSSFFLYLVDFTSNYFNRKLVQSSLQPSVSRATLITGTTSSQGQHVSFVYISKFPEMYFESEKTLFSIPHFPGPYIYPPSLPRRPVPPSLQSGQLMMPFHETLASNRIEYLPRPIFTFPFPASVEILEEIQPQIIMENETAFFVCMATGNPEPQFSWRRLDGAFPDERYSTINRNI